MTRYGHATCLCRMLVLAMTAFLRVQSPSISLDKFDDLANLRTLTVCTNMHLSKRAAALDLRT